MNESTLKEKELAWHRHPLVIAAVSFVLGGLILNCVQTKTNNAKLLRQKRIEIINSLTEYSGSSMGVFRLLNRIKKSTEFPFDTNNPKKRFLELEDELQDNIEENYRLSSKIELDVFLYFPKSGTYNKFHQLRLNFQDKISKAVKDIKSKTPQGPLFETKDFDEQQISINKILIVLIDEIGFDNIDRSRLENKKSSS